MVELSAALQIALIIEKSKDIAKEYTEIVDRDEAIIRSEDNFFRIQMEYDRVMRLFRKRIGEMLKDPKKNLTPEEKFAITNPL